MQYSTAPQHPMFPSLPPINNSIPLTHPGNTVSTSINNPPPSNTTHNVINSFYTLPTSISHTHPPIPTNPTNIVPSAIFNNPLLSTSTNLNLSLIGKLDIPSSTSHLIPHPSQPDVWMYDTNTTWPYYPPPNYSVPKISSLTHLKLLRSICPDIP